jgi:hypothetical protein
MARGDRLASAAQRGMYDGQFQWRGGDKIAPSISDARSGKK